MTDSFVTQCPHCRTSFRISRAQLGAAHGAVRCGACMQVFNAAQQLLVDQKRAQKPAPTTPEVPAAAPAVSKPAPPAPEQAPAIAPRSEKQSVDTLWIHDDLDLDSLDLDEELARLEEQEMQLSREFLELEKAPKPGEHLPQGERDEAVHDESWAESLVRDEPSPATLKIQPTEHDAPAEEVSPIAYERQEPSLGSSTDDDIDEPPVQAESETSAEEAPRRAEPALRDDSLLSLNEDPLQLDWQRPKKPWGRWIGWSLLNLIALAALAGQYVAYHFDELARQDRYRPWFETICPEIGCTLPPKVDISQIRSTNLVVRSHPQYMDALLVDAILYNRAAFAQPFPVLELRFADLNGQLIASSRFRPSQYLSGELAGRDEMPPQTPIHISLEIKDPGANAVNYSLSFHSPE